MSRSRNPNAADPMAGFPAMRQLLSLLEMAYGSRTAAAAAIERALAVAGRDQPPASVEEVVAFVRVYLVGVLTMDIGARLTMALVDDLVEQLSAGGAPAQPSGPPVSAQRRRSEKPSSITRASGRAASGPQPRAPRSVLLVDADRVSRTALARALVRAGCDVTVVETQDEMRDALRSDVAVDAVLMDAEHASMQPLLESLADARPDVVVVARSGEPHATRSLLEAMGLSRFDVRSREAPAAELLEAMKRASDS